MPSFDKVFLLLSICLFNVLFCSVFYNCFSLSFYDIIITIFLLEEKTPCSMCSTSETYNSGHNILKIINILQFFSFAASEAERYYFEYKSFIQATFWITEQFKTYSILIAHKFIFVRYFE